MGDYFNDTRQKEAFANEFMLYVTNNKRGKLDFPETWKYFNMIMDRLKQRVKR